MMANWWTRKLFAEIAKKFAKWEEKVDMDDFAWYVDEDTPEYYQMRFDYENVEYTVQYMKKDKQVIWTEKGEKLR